jgi:hypothetical protein
MTSHIQNQHRGVLTLARQRREDPSLEDPSAGNDDAAGSAAIFAEIMRERIAQDAQWGGPAHDDELVRFQWRDCIQKQLNYTRNGAREFEERMVKIAALAVAAIQASRRDRAITKS